MWWGALMESWLPAIFGFGGVLVGSFFSLWFTKLQLKHQRETDSHQWRRNVRSEPLLELRAALARMVSKQDKLLAIATQWRTTTKTEEKVKEELQGAIDDFNTYLASGDYAQTLFIQYATDIVDKAEEIRKDYKASFHIFQFRNLVNAEDMKEAMGVTERNKTRIIEVQSLINKRLEDL